MRDARYSFIAREWRPERLGAFVALALLVPATVVGDFRFVRGDATNDGAPLCGQEE